MMYHHTNFNLPSAFRKKYMNVQSCKMSTFMSIMLCAFPVKQPPKIPKTVISIK